MPGLFFVRCGLVLVPLFNPQMAGSKDDAKTFLIGNLLLFV
jgi:hypothetical protein